jgi:Diguanylate cyclase, GGDEF domain
MTHGHLAGSKLLWHVGNLIKGHLRLIDYAFRYGGDEFVVLLPQTSKHHALMVVRRLRELLNPKDFLDEEGLKVKVTASFGVAAFPADTRTRRELLRLADEAMYLVKNTTRNNIALIGEGGMNYLSCCSFWFLLTSAVQNKQDQDDSTGGSTVLNLRTVESESAPEQVVGSGCWREPIRTSAGPRASKHAPRVTIIVPGLV